MAGLSDADEILRLRERVHKLATEVAAIKLTTDLQAKRCDLVEEQVNTMVEHDKIAEAFAQGMKAARSELFSRPAKAVGLLVSLCSLVAVSIQIGRVAGWIG